MSYPNPTPIKVGMTCNLAGKRYRVAGRLVMGMEEEGETYYWNEFNLITDDEQEATLVYEETESGGEWRIFTLFEPRTPMTLAAAEAKQVGNVFDLDGVQHRVDLVDESRVYFIEGTAPEGMELGDVAHYFNAQAGTKMVVVSWTGDEVEYYRGLNLPSSTVANAFGLPQDKIPATRIFQAPKPTASAWLGKVIGIIFLLVIAFFVFRSCAPKPQFRQIAKPKIAPAPLALGASGNLEGFTWTIQLHHVVEIAMVGRIYDRHEYVLNNAQGSNALLVCDAKAGVERWIVYQPFAGPADLTPLKAGGCKLGEMITFDGMVVMVTDLFQSTLREIKSIEASGTKSGARYFGFNALEGTNHYLARWNEKEINFFKGKVVRSGPVLEAFKEQKR